MLALTQEVALWLGLMAAVVTVGRLFLSAVPLLDRMTGWGFRVIHVELSRESVRQDETLVVRAIIENTGRRTRATFYGVVKIAEAYSRRRPVHDTHRDLSVDEKMQLRVNDVVTGETSKLAYKWRVPRELPVGVYYVSVEVWNPQHLFGSKRQRRFDRTGWSLNFEVTPRTRLVG
ncbi:MAG: hypothetical protein JXA57_21075 [Armatimonadetes bacterium]|nr:hypothetical protein [Armatimonadota bacterium]